jgi:hypothetical protein
MTAREMSARIGAPVLVEVRPGFFVDCTITDFKPAFGRIDVQVAPQAGKGHTWVAANTLDAVLTAPAPAHSRAARGNLRRGTARSRDTIPTTRT